MVGFRVRGLKEVTFVEIEDCGKRMRIRGNGAVV